MQKWEYKVVRDALTEEQLNEPGVHGWELVAVTATNSAYYSICTFLKRRLPN